MSFVDRRKIRLVNRASFERKNDSFNRDQTNCVRSKTTDKVIEYKSGEKYVNGSTNVLETIDRDGILCTWNGSFVYDDFFIGIWNTTLSWNFNWSKLKNQGVERITGYLILKETANNPSFGEHKIDINFKETTEQVTKEFPSNTGAASITFEYRLTLHYAQKNKKIPYDEMFAASEMNDTVLVIEGKEVHVNKAFLSYHSEFFRALFSSNFKEGQMTVIPIEEVTYEDFGLLLSIIYPKQVFPTDRTAEKLLELANRFLMAFVIRAVEHHLLEHSNISVEKMLLMADVYGLEDLLGRCVRAMDTVKKIKALENSEDYDKLSSETCKKLFKRLVQLV